MVKDRDDYIKKVIVGKQEPHNAKIILEDYNLKWPVMFEQETERIYKALDNKALQIHHVGSTSIPGLCAKPVIDILLVVADASAELSYVPALNASGYTLHIREPDWFQHRLLKGTEPDINLHVFSEHTCEIKRMLAFRDWLRSHEDDRQKYEQVKQELAQQTWRYIQHYADAKTPIIEEIMARALGV